jgi:hypothetical protein
MATFEKLGNRREYEVRQGDRFIGWFYRYYEPAYGDPLYVGHFAGGSFWCFELEDGLPGYFKGESFKGGKKKIEFEFPD